MHKESDKKAAEQAQTGIVHVDNSDSYIKQFKGKEGATYTHGGPGGGMLYANTATGVTSQNMDFLIKLAKKNKKKVGTL